MEMNVVRMCFIRFKIMHRMGCRLAVPQFQRNSVNINSRLVDMHLTEGIGLAESAASD